MRYCYKEKEKEKKKRKKEEEEDEEEEEDILSFQNIDWTLISHLGSSFPFFKYFFKLKNVFFLILFFTTYPYLLSFTLSNSHLITCFRLFTF